MSNLVASMHLVRKQITLYVPMPERTRIDAIRQQYNPEQARLIEPHVTLCRDEDQVEWEGVRSRAQKFGALEIELRFGRPIREGNLVYLPVIGPTDDFDSLRRSLLGKLNCRRQEPHITLVHPRNGTCSVGDFDEICGAFESPVTITFRKLTFIEQLDGGPWKNLHTYPDADLGS